MKMIYDVSLVYIAECTKMDEIFEIGLANCASDLQTASVERLSYRTDE